MGICPICNGISDLEVYCKNCNYVMEEKGRLMDFYDDYSAYMEIDQLKLEDGYPTTYSNKQCPHLYYCNHCENEQVVLIKE